MCENMTSSTKPEVHDVGRNAIKEDKPNHSKVNAYSSSQTPRRYGNSHAIWDHTVLPVTRHRWHYRLYPSQLMLVLIYRPWKDERLSWTGWPTCSRWFTHNSCHLSAAGRAQDRESLPARDRRSTTVELESRFWTKLFPVLVTWQTYNI